MVEISVKSKRVYSGKGTYVGRPSTLGNPFKVSMHQPRLVAIEKYQAWIEDKIIQGDPAILYELEHLFAPLLRNEKLALVCWCSPKPCHADILKQILLNKYHTGSWLVNGRVYETMERCSRSRRN